MLWNRGRTIFWQILWRLSCKYNFSRFMKIFLKHFKKITYTHPLHSGPTGGNRQNPTFVILMQKLKLLYVLKKTLKGFGIKIKNKKILLWEKIASIHQFFNFWWILLSKKTKTLKRIMDGPLGQRFWQNWPKIQVKSNVWSLTEPLPKGSINDFFQGFCFFTK